MPPVFFLSHQNINSNSICGKWTPICLHYKIHERKDFIFTGRYSLFFFWNSPEIKQLYSSFKKVQYLPFTYVKLRQAHCGAISCDEIITGVKESWARYWFNCSIRGKKPQLMDTTHSCFKWLVCVSMGPWTSAISWLFILSLRVINRQSGNGDVHEYRARSPTSGNTVNTTRPRCVFFGNKIKFCWSAGEPLPVFLGGDIVGHRKTASPAN